MRCCRSYVATAGDGNHLVFNLEHVGDIIDKNPVELAAKKIKRKVVFSKEGAGEFAAAESHFVRLREGRTESIESSSFHLDILRDLKRIHSHICSVAYPVLERTGELQPSRLKEIEPDSGFSAAGDSAASAPSPRR